MARQLSKAGYDTTLVSANAVFSDALDTAQGFQTVIERDQEPAEAIADILHFMDPHRPYCPPQAYRDDLDALPVIGVDVCEELPLGTDRWPDEDAAWQQALLDRVDVVYRGELRYLDDTLAALWADLDALGALDDTLVVFFTDHGEQLMERGVIDHGFEIFAEENRATAAFWARSLSPRAFTGPTLHTDLAATLAGLYGLELDATGRALDDIDDDRVRRLFAYSQVDHGWPQLAVVAAGRAVHSEWDGSRSAYDLVADPGELVDVHAGPEALDADLDAFVADVRAVWPHLP